MADTTHSNTKTAAEGDDHKTADKATVADRASAATDSAKDLLAQAQTKVSEAITSAVGAAKENPKTAAAIAAGAAATIAGAAFGVSKLREGDSTSKSGTASSNAKGGAKNK